MLPRPVSVRIARGGIPELRSATASGASESAVVADGTSGAGGSLKIGFPTGSVRSRPDEMLTVGAGEAAGEGPSRRPEAVAAVGLATGC